MLNLKACKKKQCVANAFWVPIEHSRQLYKKFWKGGTGLPGSALVLGQFLSCMTRFVSKATPMHRIALLHFKTSTYSISREYNHR